MKYYDGGNGFLGPKAMGDFITEVMEAEATLEKYMKIRDTALGKSIYGLGVHPDKVV